MKRLTKKRIKFAVVGLAYSIALTLSGVMISGGGHFNLPIVLFISPATVGFLLWPLWGFLVVKFDSLLTKALFLSTIAAHYLGIIWYLFNPGNSDMYWFRIGMKQRYFILFPAFSVGLYLAGQIFLWARFIHDSVGQRNKLA